MAGVPRSLMLALLPGIALQIGFGGPGVAATLVLCVVSAVASEALLVRVRRRDAISQLREGHAALSGLLLGLALPATSPAWLPVLGGVLAMAVGKHAFGPRGESPFNPAMVALALLLVFLPQAMMARTMNVDALSSATVLDQLRHELRLAHTVDEILGGQPASATSSRWANLAFLAGGLWLLRRRLIGWRIPLGVLVGLALPAALAWASDPSRHASPLFHLLTGGTLLTALFIATAPPSSPTQPRAQWLYGLGIGATCFGIRTCGLYPDGYAFAVLLFNAAAPALDRHFGAAAAAPAATSRSLGGTLALAILTAVLATGVATRRDAARDGADLAQAMPQLRGPLQRIDALQDSALGVIAVYRLPAEPGVALIHSRANDGYSGAIEVLTAVQSDGRIRAVRVLAHRETAGIGDRIEAARDPWIEGFTGRSLQQPTEEAWRQRNEGGAFDQLSGASISARAVILAVQRALTFATRERAAIDAAATRPSD